MTELQPPSTNYHPNVPWDRQQQHHERFPSVSKDDWEEMLNRDKANKQGEEQGGYVMQRSQQQHGSFDNRLLPQQHPQQVQQHQYH